MVLDEPAVPATKFKRHVREVCELRAWHAVLASFLFFAPPVANAETVQIIDDRGGLINCLSNAVGNVGPTKRKCTNQGTLCFRVHHTAWLHTARKNLRKLQRLSRVSFGHPGFCH